MHTCELISVGTELLLGDILNTNAQYLSREMASLGIGLLHQSTVGDNPGRLSSEIKSSLSRCDIIITTGGLGPTPDDITKETVCEALGFRLCRDSAILADIESYFTRRGKVMPAENAKQADIPEGAAVFKNSCGTAPGAALEKDGKCVIILPGPPREMKMMFNESVRPFLISKYSDGVIISRNVRTFGIGESDMAHRVSDLLKSVNPSVAPYAKDGEAFLRVTASAESCAKAEALLLPVIADIKSRLSDFIYGIDYESLQEAVVKLLSEKGLRAAFAESCTAGYISKRITEIPGSSSVFECGAVTYSNAMKTKMLNVSPKTLKRFGAVSEQTAVEMARGVMEISGADIGVSVTGVAGPGDDGEFPEGLSFIGICGAQGSFAERFETGRKNAREYNRYVTASKALDMLRRFIIKNY